MYSLTRRFRPVGVVRGRRLIALLVSGMLIILALGFAPAARAADPTSFAIDGPTGCKTFLTGIGATDTDTYTGTTCILSGPGELAEGDNVAINSGQTLQILGTLTSHGTINIDGSMENPGTYRSSSTSTLRINTGGTFTNSGFVEVTGIIINAGAIVNSKTIETYGSLENSGSITNSHRLANEGPLSSSGSITNTGTIANGNTITIECGGVLNNSGNITGNAPIWENCADTTPPVISVTNMTVTATSAAGAEVDFTTAITVTDDTDPNPTVSFDPPGGSLLPLGDTLVQVTATDASGNSRTAQLTVTVVRAERFSLKPKPRISDTTPQVGQELTVIQGAWTPEPLLAYQWYRHNPSGTKAIEGATTTTYIPKTSDIGDRLTVIVTGSKTGYTSTSKTSVATHKVTPGTLSPTPTPVVDDTTPVMGQVITADPGTWGPSSVTTAFQWYRGSRAIRGATSTSYQIQTADLGTRLKVTVTGSAAGYKPATKTSAPTAKVTQAP